MGPRRYVSCKWLHEAPRPDPFVTDLFGGSHAHRASPTSAIRLVVRTKSGRLKVLREAVCSFGNTSSQIAAYSVSCPHQSEYPIEITLLGFPETGAGGELPPEKVWSSPCHERVPVLVSTTQLLPLRRNVNQSLNTFLLIAFINHTA